MIIKKNYFVKNEKCLSVTVAVDDVGFVVFSEMSEKNL